MKLCNYFQAQLLEHLYGLLDDEDRRELEEHLTACGDCRAALAQAKQEQTLLATAGRKEFAGVSFQAPPVQELTMEEVEDAPVIRSSSWFRWSVAAAILLAAFGLGIPTGLYSAQRDRVENARARLASFDDTERASRQHVEEVNRELARIETEIQAIQNERAQKVQDVWNRANQKPLHMTVIGPKTPDPGAVNNYRIQIRPRGAEQTVPADLKVRVLDETGKEVYKVNALGTNGDYQLVLPRDLPLKPNTELALEVEACADDGAKATLKEKLKLVAPVYLTHLTTDKPMYRPGETVHFRSLTLERFSLRPATDDLELSYTITKPNGEQVQVLNALSRVVDEKSKDTLLGPDGKPIHGLGAGNYFIDPETPGGEYTLTVRDLHSRFPPQERKFLVNVYEKPRLNKELEFARKSYGPGETVVVNGNVKRVEGGSAVADQPVTATMNVDSQVISAINPALKTNALGGVEARFALPRQIKDGNASVSLVFTDGGSFETITRPVPLVLKKLEVEFFPEGGDLVAGLPNRVYFQARNNLGKPAELKGRILDESGAVCADAQTFSDPAQPGANHGMGVFTFTPLAGKKYRLQIDEPEGIEKIVKPGNKDGGQFPPDVQNDGVVLSVPTGVTTDRDIIKVVVRSPKERQLLVGAYCRGRLMTHERVAVKAGQAATLELKPETGVGGVYRVTVFEEQPAPDNRTTLLPRAERLIYREPAERLNLAVSTDRQRFVPGERVQLHCLATDEKGQSAPAILMVAVVDNSVLKLADEKTYKSLPTHFLLATEVRRPEDLEHADFLIGPQASAHVALDLLLGTQGWRRFVEQQEKPQEYRLKQPATDIDRLLVLNGQLLPESFLPKTSGPEAQEAKQAFDAFAPKFEPLQRNRLKVEEAATQAGEADQALRERIEGVEGKSGERADARKAYDAEVARLASYEKLVTNCRNFGLPVLMLVLLVGALVMLARGIDRAQTTHAAPYFLGSVLALLLFGALGIYLMVAGGAMERFEQVATGMAAPQKKAAPGRPVFDAGDDKGGARGDVVAMAPAPAALDPQAPALEKRAEAAKVARPFPGKQPPMANVPGGFAGRGANKKLFDDNKAKAEGKGQGLGIAGPRVRNGGMMMEQQKQAFGLLRKNQLQERAARDGAMKQDRMKDAMQADKPMEFRRHLAAGAREAADLDEMNEVAALPPLPCLVREYAHHHSSATPGARSDFTETIYWHPVLVLPNGKGDASFELCDSVTTFQVLAAGHTLDGRLGAVTTALESRLPLTVEPKLPTEITATDKVDVPLTIANNSDRPIHVQVEAQPTDLALLHGKANERVTVDADKRMRLVYRLQATRVDGEATLAFTGRSDAAPADTILKKLKIVPDGFPIVGAQSDMLEKVARHELVLPESWVPNTLEYRVSVYPSTLAALQKGLEGLLREPCGCFEQTSTSNYPNLLILDYMKTTDQANPAVERRAKDLLASGYQKLTSFECTNTRKNAREGYEWFGGTAPAHEALTAYGLMQFRDMGRVYDVDPQMVERTRTYLMAQRDGQGGFKRNPRALDTFGRASKDITDAYIVWALTESGKDDDVTKELNAAHDKAKTSKDAYFIALVANSLFNRDRGADAMPLLKVLVEKQKQQPDGHLDAEQTSITGSGGRDLQIETTALTLLAWLKAKRPDQFNEAIQKGVKWISQQRGGYGGFGSTQSTILALKALIAFSAANKKTAEAGELTLYADDKVIARLAFPAGAEDAITLSVKNADTILKPGKNNLRIEITGKSVFPYTAAWSYRTLKPASAANVPVRLDAKLDRDNVKEGDTVRLTATVENVSGKGQGMAVAILGLPAGLTIPEDMKQLKDLARLRNDGTERGTIDFFEIRGRELVLYWRDMAPGKKIDVGIDLIARVPGEYRGPASRAYLYYNADPKHWIEPLSITISAEK
jgi:hypothetical protein